MEKIKYETETEISENCLVRIFSKSLIKVCKGRNMM